MQKLFAVRSFISSFVRNSKSQQHQAAAFSTSLLLDDTQIQFKESVAKFAQENIAPFAEKIDRTNSFPKDVNLWKLMGDFNLHGITAPGFPLRHMIRDDQKNESQSRIQKRRKEQKKRIQNVAMDKDAVCSNQIEVTSSAGPALIQKLKKNKLALATIKCQGSNPKSA